MELDWVELLIRKLSQENAAEADSRLPITRAASANQNVTNDTLREKPEEKSAVLADDSQLHRSSQPPDLDRTVLSYQDCVSDISDWMTDNKLQNKTEAMLFNSSKPQDAPASLSICQTTVTFTSVFTWIKIYMKHHISFICKTAFFELRRISNITSQLMLQKLFLSLLYCPGLTIAIHSEPASHCHRSLSFRSYKTVQPVLQFVHRIYIKRASPNVRRQNRSSSLSLFVFLEIFHRFPP